MRYRILVENNGNWAVRPLAYSTIELARREAEQYMADKPYAQCSIVEVLAVGKRSTVSWVPPQ